MCAVVALSGLLTFPASAAPFDYGLHAQKIADGVHVFEGRTEHFTRDNGGDIVNTGYIETAAGALVIDTGPSRRYGEQMRAAIESATGKPVAQVLITHAHPDHFLGNQAYAADAITALPVTRQTIQALGEDLAANLYRMVGGWMEGTEARVPARDAQPGALVIGGRSLKLLALRGHTDADLAVYDEKTRTLFAGDLVFFQRAPTTPNADLGAWLEALDQLDRLDFAVLVPGHGPVVKDHAAIVQTRAYLKWLRASLQDATRRGLDLNEAMAQVKVPPEFAKLAVFRDEFQRSVVHLYPAMELETLRRAK
nr:quinoprotein relay system zinc metallohydrolase 1 [Panacagrimonas sp.]